MICRLKRWTWLLPVLLCLAAVSFAQQWGAEPAPWLTDGVLGPQLIAWSELQKPQPVPQKPEPLPPPDTSAVPPQPPPPQDQQGQQTPPAPQADPATMQSVTGMIVKVAEKYVLETSDNLSYQLDDQERAKQYEGRHVKVTGTLDRASGILHIKNIELLS